MCSDCVAVCLMPMPPLFSFFCVAARRWCIFNACYSCHLLATLRDEVWLGSVGRAVPNSCASTSQLPFKEPQIPSNRDNEALNLGTLWGVGASSFSFKGLPRHMCLLPLLSLRRFFLNRSRSNYTFTEHSCCRECHIARPLRALEGGP